jgi:hypothetical protein
MASAAPDQPSRNGESKSGCVPMLSLVATVVAIMGIISVTNDGIELANRLKPLSEAPVLPNTSPPGLYVTRIIDPPVGDEAVKTHIYMASAGNVTYVLDAITIFHLKGMLVSGTTYSGAIEPDARYAFSFREGESRNRALNPPIRLAPTDRREVMFTVSLSPNGSFAAGGRVTAKVHYHTSNARSGVLTLREVPQFAAEASRLLKTTIDYKGEMLVSPLGLQVGDEGQQRILRYTPRQFPFFPPSMEPSLHDSVERARLYQYVESRGKVAAVIDGLSRGSEPAYDICAGLMTADCETGLLRAASNDTFFALAVDALAFRHLIRPTELLADFTLANIPRLEKLLGCTTTRTDAGVKTDCTKEDVRQHLVQALVSQPMGKSHNALIAFARFDDGACSAIEATSTALSSTIHRDIQLVCEEPR